MYNIQTEQLDHIWSKIPCNMSFLDEVGVLTATTLKERMCSNNHVVTNSVPYGDTNYKYITRKPQCFKKHICSCILDIKDIYIWYCTDSCWPISTLTINIPVLMIVIRAYWVTMSTFSSENGSVRTSCLQNTFLCYLWLFSIMN